MILKTPGVYIQRVKSPGIEIPVLESAMPAFVGYTRQAVNAEGKDVHFQVVEIRSLEAYISTFGNGYVPASIRVYVEPGQQLTIHHIEVDKPFYLYDCIRHFFDNGGEVCWIVSVGGYDKVRLAELERGLRELEKWDEPTLLLAPDAVSLRNHHQQPDLRFYQQMLAQCARLQDRFAILDIPQGDVPAGPLEDPIADFRDRLGMRDLSYGAVYYPWIYTNYEQSFSFGQLQLLHAQGQAPIPLNGLSASPIDARLLNEVRRKEQKLKKLPFSASSEKRLLAQLELKQAEQQLFTLHSFFRRLAEKLDLELKKIPVSGTLAGIMTRTDHERGVWKAPANVLVESTIGPVIEIDHHDQERLNVHSSGKSVNAIRQIVGRGTMVWGARTLAGNDLEWRYVPVRRLFIFLEESIKRALEPFVFENNDRNTWASVKGSIYNFLETFWRRGALSGATPDEAFFVAVGLNETMTAQDILEGRMIVEIGLAASRPLEFITLRFVCHIEE